MGETIFTAGWGEEILASKPSSGSTIIIESLIFTGITMLAGPPKSGKTNLATQMALAVANGDHLMGKFAAKPGVAVYLAYEEGRDLTRQRLVSMDAKITPNAFRVEYNWPTLENHGVDKLGHYLKSNRSVKLVVIDVYQRFVGAKKSSYISEYSALEKVHKIATMFNTGIVLLHHTTKKIPSDWQSGLYGSQGTTGVADTTILLDRPTGDNRGRLRVTGRKCPTREFALRFHEAPLGWQYAQTIDGNELSPERLEILEVLKECRGPVKMSEIVNVTCLGKRSVHNMLKKMVGGGLVQKTGHGHYLLTAEGVAGLAKVKM
jgi:RecA-family ATPase/predicted transcriptional regulator